MISKNKILNFRTKAKTVNLPIKELDTIKNAFKTQNGEVKIIGGAVRNIILLDEKIVDCDLVTDLNPDEMMDCLKKQKIRYIGTGLRFGTITAKIDQISIQITSLRQDVIPDGRWTKVNYTKNWFLDSHRRDFTINAIYMNLDGEIFDPFDGINDLIQKKVIFIGVPKDRIKEDYLRILRFLRFSIKYSKIFDEAGLKACINMKSKLQLISFERRYSELLKMISNINFEEKFNELSKTNILNYIFNLNINIRNVEKYFKIERFHDIVDPVRRVKFFLRSVRSLSSKNFYDKLSIKVRRRIQFKLKFNNYDLRNLNYQLYYSSKTNVLDQLIFDFADDLVKKIEFNNLFDFIKRWKKKKFPINGNDLIKMGINNGLEIGKKIKITEKWWLENFCKPNKRNCLNFVKTLPRS